jgi:glycosidase
MYPNDSSKLSHARKVLQKKARDNARTPVQWSSEAHAGFTAPGSTPWMRVIDDYRTVNAQAQTSNADTPHPSECSVLGFWKRALEFRKFRKDVFIYGDFQLIDPDHEKVVAWKRWSEKTSWIFFGNFSGEEVLWEGLEGTSVQVKQWMVSNYYDCEELHAKPKIGKIALKPWEGLLGMIV